jgi:hypothetical protein
MAVNSDRVVKTTSFGRGLYLLSVFWVRDDNNNKEEEQLTNQSKHHG